MRVGGTLPFDVQLVKARDTKHVAPRPSLHFAAETAPTQGYVSCFTGTSRIAKMVHPEVERISCVVPGARMINDPGL